MPCCDDNTSPAGCVHSPARPRGRFFNICGRFFPAPDITQGRVQTSGVVPPKMWVSSHCSWRVSRGSGVCAAFFCRACRSLRVVLTCSASRLPWSSSSRGLRARHGWLCGFRASVYGPRAGVFFSPADTPQFFFGTSPGGNPLFWGKFWFVGPPLGVLSPLLGGTPPKFKRGFLNVLVLEKKWALKPGGPKFPPRC